MSRPRTLLAVLYYVIAAIALLATQSENLAFSAERHTNYVETFAQFWPALLVNHATVSITVDIFLLSLAVVIWMVLEARRLQLRFVWLYVLGGIFVAISVTFPLFLAARERRLAALGAADTEPKLASGDVLALVALGLGTLAFVAYSTLFVSR